MYTIQQISVFVENRPGALEELLQVISENKINIRALSIADTADFGIVRLIVDHPEPLKEILSHSGFIAKTTPVLAISIQDQVGGLLEWTRVLSGAGISIEYIYAFSARAEKLAKVVMKVDNIERAVTLLKACQDTREESDAEKTPDFFW